MKVPMGMPGAGGAMKGRWPIMPGPIIPLFPYIPGCPPIPGWGPGMGCPVMGPPPGGILSGSVLLFTLVMSWMEERLLSFLLSEFKRMKYFCAWEATWVGVRVITKLRDMLRQSPFPNLARPRRKRRCSSSVQGIPLRRSWSVPVLGVLFLVLFGLLDGLAGGFVCMGGHGGDGQSPWYSSEERKTRGNLFRQPMQNDACV